MGLNTVAVIFNDFTHEFEKDGPLGQRIARAMQSYGSQHDRLPVYFGAGQVISMAHADYEQVVIAGRNGGQKVLDAKDVSYSALDQMAECLRRHGWTAKPPSRRKKKSVAVVASSQEA